MIDRPTLDLAFVGFGNVARRAVTLLRDLSPQLAFDARTVAILTSRHGGAWSPQGVDAGRAVDAVSQGGILQAWPDTLPPLAGRGSNAPAIAAVLEQHAACADEGRLVCIETTVLDIQSGEPAKAHVEAALTHRAHVVTANKGPIAFAYGVLAAIARHVRRELRFEGVVMDGVPLFNLIRDTLPGVRVTGFRGVLNSTTNHILTTIEKGGTFEEALAQMQREGIAEADPSLDVDGWDAAAKTAAMMNVLMQANVTPHDIQRQGIRAVAATHVKAAAERGERLRLVAAASRDGHRAAGHVRVESVPANDLLGSLDGMQNAVVLHTDVLGEIGILQRDGGLTQTAYAIVTDLESIARALR